MNLAALKEQAVPDVLLAHIVLLFNIVIHFYPKDLQVHGTKNQASCTHCYGQW